MYRLLSKDQIILTGNMEDICDTLKYYAFKYSTLKELIDALNK